MQNNMILKLQYIFTAKWTLLNFLLSEQKKGADLNETQIQHFLNNFLITVRLIYIMIESLVW